MTLLALLVALVLALLAPTLVVLLLLLLLLWVFVKGTGWRIPAVQRLTKRLRGRVMTIRVPEIDRKNYVK